MTELLLLEDDDQLRTLLTYRFEQDGYEVIPFENGRECWTYLTNCESVPAVLLFDVMVPGIDGFGLLKRVRADDRLAGVPVLLLTARGREADVLRGFDLGADDYVTKPFSPAAVVARVERLLPR